MKKQFEQHKCNDRVKQFITAFTLLLIILTIAAIGLQSFGNDKLKPSEWFKKQDKQLETKIDDIEAEDNNGEFDMVQDVAQNRGVSLKVTPLRASRKLSTLNDGISTQSNTPIASSDISVTISPADVLYESVEWELIWVSTTTSNINNYLGLVGLDDLNRRLECYQVFTEQALLIVSVYEYGGACLTASCTIDYRDRVTGVSSVQLFYSNSPTPTTYSYYGAPISLDVYDTSNQPIEYNIGNLAYYTSGGSIANDNVPFTHSSTFMSITYTLLTDVSVPCKTFISNNDYGNVMQLDFNSAFSAFSDSGAFADSLKSENDGIVFILVTFTLSNNQTVDMYFYANFNQHVDSLSMNNSEIVF